MPRKARGSVYKTKTGVGIRWVESGKRQHRSGFRNKTEAHDWWDREIGPKLRRGGPSAAITLNDFAAIYLDRWGVDKAERTRTTLKAWLEPAFETFGEFSLHELEGAVEDVARWRARLPTEDKRHKSTRALRQVLAAAVRWGYIGRNAALDFGPNRAAKSEELKPLSPAEIEIVVEEMLPQNAAIVLFAVETGLRTHEWIALERRDLDRRDHAVIVQRRVTDGEPIPYPKTTRRRVPLTPTAERALEMVPARIDSPILFASETGGHLNLNNWRNRAWNPALRAAGIEQRGPYVLRHSFATNALRAGVSIYDLSRLMGASVKTIDKHYGHMAHDSAEHLRALLSAPRGGEEVVSEDDA